MTWAYKLAKGEGRYCSASCRSRKNYDLRKRVEELTNRAPGDQCWTWRGSHNKAGYGRLSVGGKQDARHVTVTRLVVEFATGAAIPAGLCACHRCDNPGCVRPSHLFVGTHLDNAHDCVAKGRRPQKTCPDVKQARGERIAKAKLTAAQVKKIRHAVMCGASRRVIGAQYGVSRATVGDLIARRTWAHVP